MRSIYALVIFACTALYAAAAIGEKPNFTGTWVLDGKAGNPGSEMKVVIHQDGESIQITPAGADKNLLLLKLSCSTEGKECSALDNGHKANVRVWYNGPQLVIMKTDGRKGDVVTKQRLSLAPTGDAMGLEVIHIDPPGDAEKFVFKKQP